MSCLKTIFNNSLTKHVYSKTIRPLSTSSCLNGRKSRTPYDRRYGPRVRDVQPGQTGGSELAADLVRSLPRANKSLPQDPGYRNKEGKLIVVPEMIPEFVVPDLTNFKLKPYVSYQVLEVKQSEFTAEDLFNSCYAANIVSEYRDGKIDADALIEEEKQRESVGPLPNPDHMRVF